MEILLLVLFFLMTNFVIFPILQAVSHHTLVFGLVTNASIAVVEVYLFNAMGLTNYLLYFVPALAVSSGYTYKAIEEGDYPNNKKMKIIAAASSVTFIAVFFIYSVYLYNT